VLSFIFLLIKSFALNTMPDPSSWIFHITDKQFSMMEVFISQKKEELPRPAQQLEIF